MNLQQAAEDAALGFEAAGVIALTLGSLIALVRYGQGVLRRQDLSVVYRSLRKNLGYAMLLGLELLIVADIIRTVAVEPTLMSVSILGLIVVIRTFLSWSLEVEIEGTWPWQRSRSFEPTLDQGSR